jgi:Ca2+-binding RTX toxin-like protein
MSGPFEKLFSPVNILGVDAAPFSAGNRARRCRVEKFRATEQLETKVLLSAAGPTLDSISDIMIQEDSASYNVALTGIGPGNGNTTPVRISASFQSASVSCGVRVTAVPSSTSATLTLEPARNSFGTGTVSVTVENFGPDGKLETAADNLTVVKTFKLTVNPVSFRIDGKTLGIELDNTGDVVNVSRDMDLMQFHLSNRIWHGTDNENVSGNGTSVLRVSAAGQSFLTGLQISDAAPNTQIVFSGSTTQSIAQSIVLQQSLTPRPIVINSTIRLNGTAGLEARSSGAIVVNSVGRIESTDGAIILNSAPTNGTVGQWGSGVNIAGGFVGTTGRGSIAISGTGSSIAGSSPDGVVISAGAKIIGATTQNVVIVGSGGHGNQMPSRGIVVSGAGSEIVASGTGLSITGTGGNSDTAEFNSGIQLDGGGSVRTVGAASMDIVGFGGISGGNYNRGVHVSGAKSRVETVNGLLSIKGTGGGRLGAGHNVGVFCDAGGQVSVLGTGNLQVTGKGGSGSGDFNRGLAATGSLSGFYARAGNMVLNGTGGGIGNSVFNSGVFLDAGSRANLEGSGALSIIGRGGLTNGDQNRGVLVAGETTVVSSSAGTVQISGTGGGIGLSAWNYGVSLEAGATVLGSPGALSSILGTGGKSTGLNNRGVVLTGETTRIAGDQIKITGYSGGTGSGTIAPAAALLESGAQVLANHGSITIIADNLEIATDSSVDSGTDGTVNIAPSSTGRKITLGSSTRKETSLNLSQVTLDCITAHNLFLGNEFTGSLTIVGDVNLRTSQNLTLKSAEAIHAEVGNVVIAGGQLTLLPGLNKAMTGRDQVSLGSKTNPDINIFTLVPDPNRRSPDAAIAAVSVTGRLVLNDPILQLNHAADLEAGGTWLLIQNDGTDPIAGRFRNMDTSGGIVIDNITFRVSMNGGDGNDVTLTRESNNAVGDVWGTTSPDVFVVEPSTPSGSGTFKVSKSVAGQVPIYVGSISRDLPLNLHGIAGDDDIVIRGTTVNDLFVVSGSTILLNGFPIIISGIENVILAGGAGNDRYQICADLRTGNVRVDDVAGDTDTLDFSTTTLNPVSLSLAELSPQRVNENLTLQLNSSSGIENLLGGAKADVLYGNSLPNTISGNDGADRMFGGLGNDLLIGGNGSDQCTGGAGDDTYLFAATLAAEADQVTENTNEGVDTLNFAALTTGIIVNLGSTSVQPVHTNRTLKLNSAVAFENLIGGTGADTLFGNSLANTVTGGAGDDKLIGATGNDLLLGGANNDTYVFVPTTVTEADQVTENANDGIDTLSFAFLTTDVVVNLGSTLIQSVHTNRKLKLNSAVVFENIIGGSGADTLFGNTLENTLNGNAGDDKLLGAGGNDVLLGGANNDTYIFVPSNAVEADQVSENANEGIDTLNFASLTTSVVVNLGTTSIQSVNLNRTLKLNSLSTFENAVGGTGSDTLFGNALANRLTGGSGDNILVGLEAGDILEAGSGRDILIGGQGLDILKGGAGDDILIAGTTTSDTRLSNLHTLRTHWISGNAYADSISNLRTGVGSPLVSLKAKINVLNDAGERDVLYGGTGTDLFFRAVDDVITDLFAGEIIDVL